MAANIDSYVTNWFRVTDRTALDQLIERFHERSEVAGSQGENWTVSEDGDGRVRVTAHDLSKPPLIYTTRKPMKKSKSKPVFLAYSPPVRSSILRT